MAERRARRRIPGRDRQQDTGTGLLLAYLYGKLACHRIHSIPGQGEKEEQREPDFRWLFPVAQLWPDFFDFRPDCFHPDAIYWSVCGSGIDNDCLVAVDVRRADIRSECNTV